MKQHKYKPIMLGLLFSGLLFDRAFAQLEIKKHSINSGSTVMQGTGYEMKSSIAQTDASVALTAANYELTGGFWNGSDVPQTIDLIFKNNFEQ